MVSCRGLWPQPLRLARIGTLWLVLPAAVTFAAYIRALGSAGRSALPAAADHPVGARREAITAQHAAFHPHIPRARIISSHVALAPVGAERLLTIGPVHFRAYRGPFIVPDTLLACGAAARLACRKAYRFGDGVRAEEAVGTGLCGSRPAWSCAPTPVAAAQQLGGARRFFFERDCEAALPFLALALGDTELHQRSVPLCGYVSADLIVRALHIRDALAVGAVGRWNSRVP
jgi:hypothetical protein